MEQHQSQLDEIKVIMADNVGQIVERSVNLQQLTSACEHLETQAQQFNVSCRRVKRKMCLKNFKTKLVCYAGFCLLLVAIVFIILVLLHFFGSLKIF